MTGEPGGPSERNRGQKRGLKLDTSVAHPARVYDYWLGGKDNFAADREAAEAAIAVNPFIVPGVRTNREFLGRAVRYLAGEAGIRQFLDIGTGIPTADNTHEVAQAAAPQARIVYVDNDPIVLLHARELLTSTDEGATDYIEADLHDRGHSWRQPRPRSTSASRSRSCCWRSCSSSATPGPVPDRRRADGRVRPGSYLVLSHPASDVQAEAMAGWPAASTSGSAERAGQVPHRDRGSPVLRRPGPGRARSGPAASLAPGRGHVRAASRHERLVRRGPQAMTAVAADPDEQPPPQR